MFDFTKYEFEIVECYKKEGMQESCIALFRKLIYDYYNTHKRDFPWRNTTDPYAVFVSEVMLQQTQTTRVVPKFLKFMEIFPGFAELAAAPVPLLLETWQGLGYNRRALNLQKAATEVVRLHNGILPADEKALLALPGVGKYTCAAVRAFAFNQGSLVIDTNIRAVYIYFFFQNRENVTDDDLLPLIEKTLDPESSARWYSALMDFGVYLKANTHNPARKSKHYTKQSKFEGSQRQIRGKIIKTLCSEKTILRPEIYEKIRSSENERVDRIIESLIKEKFIICDNNRLSLYNKE